MEALLVVGASLSVLAGVVGAQVTAHREHRAALRRWAREHGWTWRGRDGAEAHRHPSPLLGQVRCATDVLSGTWGGRPCVAYDLRAHRTRAGLDGSPQVRVERAAVLVVRVRVPLPDLLLQPRTAVGRLLHRRSDPLRQGYRVRGPGAAEVLQPGAVPPLLAARDLHLQVVGDEVVCWRRGRSRPDELEERLAVVTAVLDAVPLSVWCAQPLPGRSAARAC